MDYAAVARGLQESIPFTRTVGIEITAMGEGTGTALLPDGDPRHNHVGSQHAGALFTAGETASGAAFVGAFAADMGGLTVLAEGAEISYRKLARGPITAQAELTRPRQELLDALEAEGRVRFPIAVSLRDEGGDEVASMEVRWYVRRDAPAAE